MKKLERKNQGHKSKENLADSVRGRSRQKEIKQTSDWKLSINFVPFENDDVREKSYELWVESLFGRYD